MTGAVPGALAGPVSAKLSMSPEEYYGMSEEEREQMMLRALLFGALTGGVTHGAGMNILPSLGLSAGAGRLAQLESPHRPLPPA